MESWKSVYTLLHGDTFFVFCCKICNDGEEFVRRLDFNFKTALHLVLYDFAMTRAQKSYSVSKEIAPFLIDNWDKLNIPFDVSCYYRVYVNCCIALIVQFRSTETHLQREAREENPPDCKT